MRRFPLFAVLFLTLAFGAPPGHADTIFITAGTAIIGPGIGSGGPINLTGTNGFTLNGFLSSQGNLGAKLCSPCEPGFPLSLFGTWSGTDIINGVATLKGVTYPDVGGLNSPNGMLVEFNGSAGTAPPVGPLTSIMFTAPFTFEAMFVHAPNLQTLPEIDTLLGSGLATLTLRRVPGVDDTQFLWNFGDIRYDFADAAAPIPEPGSLLLIASGLGLAYRRLRR